MSRGPKNRHIRHPTSNQRWERLWKAFSSLVRGQFRSGGQELRQIPIWELQHENVNMENLTRLGTKTSCVDLWPHRTAFGGHHLLSDLSRQIRGDTSHLAVSYFRRKLRLLRVQCDEKNRQKHVCYGRDLPLMNVTHLIAGFWRAAAV